MIVKWLPLRYFLTYILLLVGPFILGPIAAVSCAFAIIYFALIGSFEIVFLSYRNLSNVLKIIILPFVFLILFGLMYCGLILAIALSPLAIIIYYIILIIVTFFLLFE